MKLKSKSIAKYRIWQYFGFSIINIFFITFSLNGQIYPEGSVRIAKWNGNKTAALTLLFDDSTPGQATLGIPSMNKRNVVGTWFVNPGNDPFKTYINYWTDSATAGKHELANHTMTHTGADTYEKTMYEVGEASRIIWGIRGQEEFGSLIAFNRGGATVWNEAYLAEALATFKNVDRLDNGGVRRLGRTILAGSTAAQMLLVFPAILKDSLFGFISFHGIAAVNGNPPLDYGVGAVWINEFNTFLDSVVNMKDKFWICGHIAAYKYCKERLSSTISMTKLNKDQYSINLSTRMDPFYFNEPLTIMAYLPYEWDSCEVIQNGNNVLYPVNAGVLMFDALPDNGEILITHSLNQEIWTGEINNSWSNPGNWSRRQVPISSTNVTIPSVCSFSPVILDTGAMCNHISIDASASLFLTGLNKLEVSGNWTNHGCFTSESTTTLRFKNPSFISGPGVNTFGNLVFDDNTSCNASSINISGNLQVNKSFNQTCGMINFNGTCQAIRSSQNTLIFNDLTIDPNATIFVNPETSITVLSYTIIEGNLLLESDEESNAQASFIDNGIIQNGKAYIQKVIDSYQYSYISPPIQSPDLDTASNAKSDLFTLFGGIFNSNLYWYDESIDINNDPLTSPEGIYNPDNLIIGWKFMQRNSYSPITNLMLARGYSFYSYSTGIINFIGKLNTGNIIPQLSFAYNDPFENPSQTFYDGWNLVGNPYPSSIDWDIIRNSLSNMDDAFYIWDGENKRYSSYIDGIGTNNQTNIILPMQGFFVHTNGPSPQFYLNNACRLHHSSLSLKKTELKTTVSDLIKIKINAGGKLDEAVVYFKDKATEDYDGKYDALSKFSWNADTLASYYNYQDIPNIYTLTKEGKLPLSINAIPDSLKFNINIPLGIRLGTSEEISISLNECNLQNINVYLNDKDENKLYYLSNLNTYNFNFEKGDKRERFELMFVQNSPPFTGECIQNKQFSENEVFSFSIPENLFIESDQGDKIQSFSANLENGDDLPWWLKFNANDQIFTGNPGYQNSGTYKIKINAVDVSGGIGSCTFKLEIYNVNNQPILTNSLADQEIDINEFYSFQIPDNTFSDIDLDDELSIAVNGENGSDLPSWLNFDNQQNTLSGNAECPGNFIINVIATDSHNSSISDEFNLIVKNTMGTAIQEKLNIKVFPNPTSGTIFIKTGELKAKLIMIIRDYSGKIIKQVQLLKSTNIIDMGKFTNGIYLIEIVSEFQHKAFKLVLQR